MLFYLVQFDVDKYLKERDESKSGVMDVYKMLMHCNIYADLFGHAFFYPVQPMSVFYDINDDECIPVYCGNEVTPTEVG